MEKLEPQDILAKEVVAEPDSPEHGHVLEQVKTTEKNGDIPLINEDNAKKIAELRERLRSTGQGDPIINAERERIAQDQEFQAMYSEIIEQNNFGRLREKSAIQLDGLKKRYFGRKPSFWNLKEKEVFRQKEKKLQRFTEFVESLTPVRADRNKYEEYLSPARSGNINSYGPQDILVHAERFVYGSFAEMGHWMSQGLDQRQLDTDDIAPRAQIVMQDIANVAARVSGDGSFVKKYLQNLFDWDNGKKILALYLASVFDTPQQAHDALSIGQGHPQIAGQWEEYFTYYDPSFTSGSTEEFLNQRAKDQQLTQVLRERMQKMLEDTGIEPPLSLEIRVKDSAKVA